MLVSSDGTSDNEGGSDGILDGEDNSDGDIEIEVFEGANDPTISCSPIVVTGTPDSIIFFFKSDLLLFMTPTRSAIYLDGSIFLELDAINSYVILNIVLPDVCSCRRPVLLVVESCWSVTVA